MTETITGIVILCVVCAATLMAGCLDNPDPNAVSLSEEFEVGDRISNENTGVAVIDVFRMDYYMYEFCGQTTPVTAPADKTFVFVYTKIINIGRDNDYRGAADFCLEDSDGRRYSPQICLSADAMGHFQELYKGQHIEGFVMFEVPDDVDGLLVKYDFGNIISGTKIATWAVNDKER